MQRLISNNSHKNYTATNNKIQIQSLQKPNQVVNNKINQKKPSKKKSNYDYN